MLNESYEAGQCEAIEMLEKVAGEEFLEKLAAKEPGMIRKLLERMGKYHKGAWKDLRGKGGITTKSKGGRSGATSWTTKPAKTVGEKARSIGRGALKLSPHAAAVGGAGYGGYQYSKKKKKK